MRKVLIAPMTLEGVEGEFVRALREAGYELVYPRVGRQLTEDEILHWLTGIEASLAGSEPYTARVLAAHPQLKVIARVGVGYDAVDVPAATRQGIAVTITPGTNHDAVAEHTFALMLALARDIVSQHNQTVAGGWPRRATQPLRGRTLGLAGLGRIGRAVAARGLAFKMKVIAYDPFVTGEPMPGVQMVSFDELLTGSDYLSLHLPATAESRHLINRHTLAKMKPTAYLINTARGAVINEPDLIEALRSRRIAGAALDVFEEEPPGDTPLFKLDNLVVTPHAAGTDLQSRDDMALSAATAIISLGRGEWPAEKIVNPQVKDSFRW